MSIEDVISQVVGHINGQMSSSADSMRGVVTEARSQVTDIGSEITSEGEALRGQVDSLLARASEAVDRVTEASNSFINAAEQAGQATAEAIDEEGSLLESARTVVETLDQGVQALVPEADEVMSSVEGTINTLAEEVQSQEQGMDELRAATEEHLRDPFNELMNTISNEIFDRGDVLGNFISSDLLPSFASEVESYKGYADEVVQAANEKAEEVRSTAETEGSDMLGQVQDMFGEQFGSLIETAQTVADLIDRVGQAISGTTEVVGTTMETLSQGVNLTAIGAKSAIGIVEDIIEIFQSVT